MAKKKPTVYFDTNIFSVLFYRGGDVHILHQQLSSWDWWDNERKRFQLHGSLILESELAAGSFVGQKKALAMAKRLPYLTVNQKVKACARSYLDQRIVPEAEIGDAAHLAIATVHRVDYLLTWNHAHLANFQTQQKLMELNQHLGFESPLLASPETIPKALLGQEIRRKDRA